MYPSIERCMLYSKSACFFLETYQQKMNLKYVMQGCNHFQEGENIMFDFK